MTKRIFLLTIFFVAVAGGSFAVFKPNPEKEMKKALSCFKEGQYPESEALLPFSVQTSLYKGYIELAKGRFDVAHRHLKAASKEAKKSSDLFFKTDVELAQALNAYFEGSDAECLEHIRVARDLNSGSSDLIFCQALEQYLVHSYASSFKLWNSTAEEKNTWLSILQEKLFNDAWIKLHKAHCLIEQGDILAAREIIEKENRLAGHDTGIIQFSNMLLGLSYLKEGQKIPTEQRESYYKLAHFYFERGIVSKEFSREKVCVIHHIEKEALDLLISANTLEQRQWGFDFIRTLQAWHAETSIDHIAGHLASKLIFQKNEGGASLCEAVRKEFQGTPFHLLLTEKMLTALSQAIKSGETEDLMGLWALVENIAPSPKMASKKMATLTADAILETIQQDNHHLSRTQSYLAFWEKLGRTPAEKNILAANLVIYSKTFWHTDHQEKKGQHLMELALSLSPRNSLVENEISNFLTALYAQAEKNNMISRLTLVYDAMDKLGITPQGLISQSTIANHIADASYLYEVHNYSGAKTNAGWVLRLDPKNQEALRLAGLSSFQMGEYSNAYAHLKNLTDLDEASEQAMMLSQAFAFQEQTRNLCQTDPKDTYEEE